MTADPQNRLAARCRACGELFWTAAAPLPVDVACPACEQPVPVPAGRFEGVRNLVSYASGLGAPRLQRLEESLTWTDEQLRGRADPDDEFVTLRSSIVDLDPGSAAFWREALLMVVGEVMKEPRPVRDEAEVTAMARRVVQLVMGSRSFEPRSY